MQKKVHCDAQLMALLHDVLQHVRVAFSRLLAPCSWQHYDALSSDIQCTVWHLEHNQWVQVCGHGMAVAGGRWEAAHCHPLVLPWIQPKPAASSWLHPLPQKKQWLRLWCHILNLISRHWCILIFFARSWVVLLFKWYCSIVQTFSCQMVPCTIPTGNVHTPNGGCVSVCAHVHLYVCIIIIQLCTPLHEHTCEGKAVLGDACLLSHLNLPWMAIITTLSHGHGFDIKITSSRYLCTILHHATSSRPAMKASSDLHHA